MINAENKYLQNKVLTASPPAGILMLYDGAIKFSNIALTKLEKGDLEGTNLYIQKSQNIITYLLSILNYNYEVSNDFERIYGYIYDCLLQANIKKDKSYIEKALNELRDIREIWKKISNL